MLSPSTDRRRKSAVVVSAVLMAFFFVDNPCAAQITFTKSVSASSDDAEESSLLGTTSINSTDLQLGVNGLFGNTVGMRFTAVAIPKGAKIKTAYIQFKTDATNSGGVSLTIRGQANDNAATFTSGLFNVTSRATTSASVAWSPPAWNTVGQAGVNQRTPDISAIIQEIVNRSGWSSGNSLVVIINGSGTRTAESYDGDSFGAPMLYVEYTNYAHWKLDETSGTTAADASGGGNTGAVTGTAAWTTGIINNGFSFDGSTKIVVPGLMNNPTNFTLAGWANLTAPDTSGAEIINLGGRVTLRLDEGTLSRAAFYDGSAWISVSINRTFAGDGWHHFAATFDDGANLFKLYVDGVEAASTTTTSSASYSGGGSNTVIGSHGNTQTVYDFTGKIDDARVYRYALTATQVAELYGHIGHWKLAETSGTTAADSTVFAQNGTVNNGASWSTRCNGAGVFDFNGSTQYITVANASHLQPTSALTIAGWVKGDSWGASGDVDTILSKGDTNPNNYQLAVADGKLALYLDDSDENGIRSATTLNTGQWYHFVATWDGTAAKIYIDGVLDASAARSGTIAADTRNVYIGGIISSDCFDGMIYDVRLYNRAITAAEVAQLHGLVGHWKLDESSGSIASDSSGSGGSGTVTGAAAWTAGAIDNALQLDGATKVTVNGLMKSPRNVSLAAWANLTTADSGGSEIVSIGDCLALRLDEGTVSHAFFYNGSTTVALTPTQTFAGAGWHHFAVVLNDDLNSFALYVDGVLSTSTTTTSSISYSGRGTNTLLGCHGNGQTVRDFTGKLDDVRIYNRAICPADVQALFDGGNPSSGVRILQWVETR